MENNESTDATIYLENMSFRYNGDLDAFIHRCQDIFRKREKKIEKNKLDEDVEKQDTSGYQKPVSEYTNITTTSSEGLNLSYQKVNGQLSDDCFLLTIPITLSTFSIIDFVGKLLKKEKEFKNEKQKKDFLLSGIEENFNAFFKDYINEGNKEHFSALQKLYRNGLVHSYFPFNKFAVNYLEKPKEDKLFFIDEADTTRIVLNVNYLTRIVREILNKSIGLSKTTNREDIQKRYKDWKDLNDKECKQISELILQNV